MRFSAAVAVAVALCALALAPTGCHGCSNFLVARGASDDNSTMIAYNSDGQAFYGYATSLPGGTHPAGSTHDVYEFGTGVYMGTIPEAASTYTVIGNQNEKGVAIGETTFDGIASLATQPGAVVDYYSLMWLALQRSATAREAIAVMDNLTRAHGYASTGESFSVSDPSEAWHVDWIGRGPGERGAVWVAVRVPDGHVGGHANQARITTWSRDPAQAMWSEDVVEFAVAKGLYPASGDPLQFSFADVFDPLTPLSARLCEARVWDLLSSVAGPAFAAQHLDYALGKNLSNRMPLFVRPLRPVSLNATMWAMRRHYEGTALDARGLLDAGPFRSPYRQRPIVFSDPDDAGATFAFNRNLGYVGTFFHFVAHGRPPASAAGSVIWFGVDDASLSVRVPLYGKAREAPRTWAHGVGDTGRWAHSAYWRFNAVANWAYTKPSTIAAEVQSRVASTERSLAEAVAEADRRYAEIAASKGEAAAVAFLTNFSVATADDVTDAWADLWTELFVKYRDGLVVGPPTPPAKPRDLPPPPDCESHGYDAAWARRVIASTGDRYRVPPSAARLEAHERRKAALLSRL